MEEVWRSVCNYEGLYEVSNTQKVRSVDRIVVEKGGKSRHLKGKEIVKTPDSHGYLMVNLWKDNKMKRKYLHRLIAEAFIPNPDHKEFIDHIDTNYLNNDVSNLRWVSRTENNNNPLSLMHSSESHKSDECIRKSIESKNRNGSSGRERTVGQFKDGELVATYTSLANAERETGYNKKNICANIYGKRKIAYGYTWEYLDREDMEVS